MMTTQRPSNSLPRRGTAELTPPPIKLHSPPLTPPLQGRGVYPPKSGSILSKVWKRSFQSLEAFFPKPGCIAFKVWKGCFYSLEASLLMGGNNASDRGRLQDYRITPYFLNPGFQKTANIYYIFNKLYAITHVYTYFYIRVNKYT